VARKVHKVIQVQRAHKAQQVQVERWAQQGHKALLARKVIQVQ
jgi:hypothetical protein